MVTCADPKKKKTKVVDKADYEKVVNELAELKLEFALGQVLLRFCTAHPSSGSVRFLLI